MLFDSIHRQSQTSLSEDDTCYGHDWVIDTGRNAGNPPEIAKIVWQTVER